MNGVTSRNATGSLKLFSSYGTIRFYHLGTDGACLTGGQVTVVAALQVDANLGSCLHLELIHGLTRLRNVDLVVAALFMIVLLTDPV